MHWLEFSTRLGKVFAEPTGSPYLHHPRLVKILIEMYLFSSPLQMFTDSFTRFL